MGAGCMAQQDGIQFTYGIDLHLNLPPGRQSVEPTVTARDSSG